MRGAGVGMRGTCVGVRREDGLDLTIDPGTFFFFFWKGAVISQEGPDREAVLNSNACCVLPL